jgi:hypothetical protein
MKAETTFANLERLLNNATDQEPDGSAFLEGDRKREREYSQRSVQRWLEVIQIMNQARKTGPCLDIGTSPLTFVLKHWCSTVDTLDFSNHFASRCQKADIQLYLTGDDWLGNLADDRYDCIVFLEVIEHMHMNPETILAQLQKKLRPGGILIMSTPNLMCFGNRLKILTNGKLSHLHYPPFKPPGLHGIGHDRIYTPAEMKEYFQHTHWTSFEMGYHSLAVSDSIKNYSPSKRLFCLPIQLIKYFFPSTRQLMLVVARK